MKKSIYLAAEAWRQAYGQLATQKSTDVQDAVQLQYTLPTGEVVSLHGWREEVRGGATVYIGPDGQECDTLLYAWEAVELERRGVQQGAALRAMNHLSHKLKEGHAAERPAADSTTGDAPSTTAVSRMADITSGAKGFAFSQLDDYLHRGSHPILRHMSLYVYSVWVYRVELSPYQSTDASTRQSKKPRFVDIPFDESYPARMTWVQRLSSEPRVPKVEGMQFVSEADMETHCMLKAVLLRPLYLEDDVDPSETRHQRIVRTFQQLCVAPPTETPWPALPAGPDCPGPFERGWAAFMAQQNSLAWAARRKFWTARGYANLWATLEVQEELDQLAVELAAAAPTPASSSSGPSPMPMPLGDIERCSVEEYCALEVVRTAANFAGIARARSEKPQRQIALDARVAEEPVAWEGAGGHDDAQADGAGEREQLGLGVFGQNVTIAYQFDDQMLHKVLSFDTAERTSAFVKEFQKTSIMSDGGLPKPCDSRAVAKRREVLGTELQQPFAGLDNLGARLPDVVELQRRRLGKGAVQDDAVVAESYMATYGSLVITQSVSQSVTQAVSQSVSRSISQSISQSVSQSVGRSNNVMKTERTRHHMERIRNGNRQNNKATKKTSKASIINHLRTTTRRPLTQMVHQVVLRTLSNQRLILRPATSGGAQAIMLHTLRTSLKRVSRTL